MNNPTSYNPEATAGDTPARPNLFQRITTILTVIFQIMLVIGVIILTLLVPGILTRYGIELEEIFIDFLVVMLLGALVGFVEIISRYQDAPFRTALTWPGVLYMWVNAVVAAAALWLIRLFGWTFVPGATASVEVTRWTQVISGGLGAMAIFRSSIFVLGKEEEQISVGPSAVLEILLNAIDKEVDRLRGKDRAQTVKKLMGSLHYDHVVKELRPMSLYLMQNLSNQDINEIATAVDQVEKQSNDPEVRKYLLALRLLDVVGNEVLDQAINIRGLKYYEGQYSALRTAAAPPTNPAAVSKSPQEVSGAPAWGKQILDAAAEVQVPKTPSPLESQTALEETGESQESQPGQTPSAQG